MLKNEQVLLGSHVKMSGSDMFLGSVNEALSYGANTFMLYTGAPQNTKRKEVSELNVPAGRKRMEEAGISRFIVHAPYIINLGNAVKPETFGLGVEFLIKELNRSAFMGGETLVLHPGSHVGEGVEVGIKTIVKGLNEVLSAVPEETKKSITISLETMAGKGSEVGRTFEELAMIFDGVADNDRLRVCFDTCHTWDAGYNIKDDFDGVINTFDHILGIDRIAAFHINDSKNPMGAAKDRHANIGDGFIGEDALRYIVFHDSFANVPKVLETPYIGEDAPYKAEIARLRKI